jgi:hypothetical protein
LPSFEKFYRCQVNLRYRKHEPILNICNAKNEFANFVDLMLGNHLRGIWMRKNLIETGFKQYEHCHREKSCEIYVKGLWKKKYFRKC